MERLLQFINARNVRCVVIGSAAFPVHGYARATLDVDFLIDPERENAVRMRDALADFGYDVSDVTVEDLQTRKVLFRQRRLQADVHPYVAGATFEQVWANRVPGTIGATTGAFASLEDLIAMKGAAGRPKDLEDLRVLRELKARKG